MPDDLYAPPGWWELADLVSPADLAEELGVGKSAVSNWIARYESFPPPLRELAGGPVFSRQQVMGWAQEHQMPRGRFGNIRSQE